jgi:hypothetical protein
MWIRRYSSYGNYIERWRKEVRNFPVKRVTRKIRGLVRSAAVPAA